MYESLRDCTPSEILFGVLGMLESLRMLEESAPKADVLEDVAHNIKWVLMNTTMYKKEQTTA